MSTQYPPTKCAIVQWFIRIEEIPPKKQKLLEREAHPNEIFLYESSDCDNQINAETLLKDVKVCQIAPDQQFPQFTPGDDVFFVKLNWDGKRFNKLPREALSGKVTNSSEPVHDYKILDCLPRRTQKYDLSSDPNNVDIDCKFPSNIVKMPIDYSFENKKSIEISKVKNSNSMVKKNPSHNDIKKLSKRKQMDILFETLDEQDDCPWKLQVEMKPQAVKHKLDFNGISDDPISPSKLFSQTMKNNLVSPLVQTGRARDNHDVTLQLSSVLKDSKMKRCDSTSTRNNSKIDDIHRPKKIITQTNNIRDTPSSRRKSVSRCSIFNMDDDENYQGSAESSGNEFIPDNEMSGESSTESESRDDDDSFRGKSAKKTPPSMTKLTVKTSTKLPGARTPRTPRTPCNPTPFIPRRSQLAKKPISILEEARQRLHVSAVPKSLTCREQEFQDIYNFVESKVIDGTGGCMYISGVPGTGKTATVHEVMRCLQRAAEQENIPSFHFIEINGMKLTDPHQCYVQILKLLTGQKATADHAAVLLEKRFGTPAPKRETTVLLVDELDLLWTRKQNVMYNLVDWPTRKQAKLVVLAIANTMDLPERIMMNRVASRLGLTRMSFQPYTYKQLQQIISSRLNRLKAFENDAIQLVARKVAALSGDARRALDICRRAAEICEYSISQKTASSLVGMPHVLQAIDEMFSSPYITAIRNASVQEQIFLRAVLAEFQRLGLEEATFQQIYHHHIGLCRIEGFQPPTISETMLVCTRLGACRLLLVESTKNDLHLRIRLNVSPDYIMYALKED
ncbi:origin recognition complex subunit 1 isoform X2 [Narcine bancroftii]|uniref:origin recognition complex subunit 1 isoform X2 n=1 Tax=Narcine bancroftii TaxID=1343680 RepID=UPI0038312A02